MKESNCPRSRAHAVVVAAGTVVALSIGCVNAARADELQNRSVRGLDSQLYSRGFGGYIGTGVLVGLLEAENAIPNYNLNSVLQIGSLMPLGNRYLPRERFRTLAQGGFFGADDTVGNHASTVAGCIVSSHEQHYGVARGADLLAAGFEFHNTDNFDVDIGQSTGQAIHNTQGMALQGTRVINQSWGIIQARPNPAAPPKPPAPPPPQFINPSNNGRGVLSRFTDWATRTKPGEKISDMLIVVAGNEGDAPGGFNDYGSPSDAYNVLNVGATGQFSAFDGLGYDSAAKYNLSNETADKSPITHRGRFNTHMVAPGGDPRPAIGPLGTVGDPTGSGQFFGTSGGQVTFVEVDAAHDPIVRKYQSDDRAGILGLTGTGLINQGGLMWETDPDGPIAPPEDNPGIGLRFGVLPQYSLSNEDEHQTYGTAGTSFAAPLVSGAAANLVQYGTANGENLDHRVLKAVLMNGATKRTYDGAELLRHATGPGTWTNAISVEDDWKKPDLIRGGEVPLQVGLDEELGTGQLDMLGSFVNYSAGEQGPGEVKNTGYDLNWVEALTINTYEFTTFGGEFRATLVWDRIVDLKDANGNGQWDFDDDSGDKNLTPGEAWESLDITDLTDLDLELYLIDPVLGPLLVDLSTSDIDNAEHIWAPFIPAGQYELLVLNQDFDAQEYAVAWMVPAPGAVVLLAMAGAGAARRRRRGG